MMINNKLNKYNHTQNKCNALTPTNPDMLRLRFGDFVLDVGEQPTGPQRPSLTVQHLVCGHLFNCKCV